MSATQPENRFRGRYKIRTCDPFRVREVRYLCANRPKRVTTYVIWRTSASAMSPPTHVRHVASLWNHWFEGRYGGFVCMAGILPTSDRALGVVPGIAPWMRGRVSNSLVARPSSRIASRMRGAEFRHCRRLPYVPQPCPAHPGRNTCGDLCGGRVWVMAAVGIRLLGGRCCRGGGCRAPWR